MARRGAHSIEINADCESVFDLIHNYQVRLEWDPMLASAELLDGANCAAQGVRSRCVGNWKCLWIPVEASYVSFESGKVAAVKMTNRPWFFKEFAATIRHESLGESKSKTTYIYSFESRPSWISPILDPVMNSVLSREVKHRLGSLKRYIEAP